MKEIIERYICDSNKCGADKGIAVVHIPTEHNPHREHGEDDYFTSELHLCPKHLARAFNLVASGVGSATGYNIREGIMHGLPNVPKVLDSPWQFHWFVKD